MDDTVTEIDYSDPENPVVTERPLTAAEIAQRDADALEAQVRAQEAADRETARLAAIAHARDLGFTNAMIAAMWPALGAEQ